MKFAGQWLLTVIVACWASLVAAQGLEVIELRSKTVAEVLPSLLPLVEAGGTLTGLNNQLFLRTSPDNRADIKRALAAIDKPARRLIIHVSQDRQQADSGRGAALGGELVLGGSRPSQVAAQVWDSRHARRDGSSQRVQTIEGERAFIQVGRSLPLPMRQIVRGPVGTVVNEGVVYRDVGSGFYASPRLSGRQVTLEITQQAEQMNDPRGGIASQRLATTVRGQLGEWIELGGSGREGSEQHGGFSVGTRDGHDRRTLWLMVEEVD